jgi:cytochrome c
MFWLSAAILVALSGPGLAQGDAAKGKTAFAKCALCHQVGPNAQTVVGPELNAIVGRKAASVSGYAYSPGMK